MTVTADTEFAVLNAVYLRKIATPEVIGDVCGLPAQQIAELVSGAVGAGQLEDVGGMYMISQTGTAELLAAYRSRYLTLRTDAVVLGWYERFEGLNKQFLQAISAWQTDRGSDPGKLDRLLRLVDRLTRSLAALEPTIPRYHRYVERFTVALDRVDAGATEFVTSPTVDSVHNIWFEFHEDILTVVGRPRDVAEAQA